MNDLLPLLATAFLVGFAGSLHCIGMCGPIVVALTSGSQGRTATRLSLFMTGKTLTYFGLGVAAGTVGVAVGSPNLGTNAFSILAVVAGSLMVLMGAYVLFQKVAPKPHGKPGPLSVLVAATLRSRGRIAALAAGGLTGLLPCGLVYAMVARSLAAGGPLLGGLIMASFGIGTTPVLIGTGTLSRVLTGRARRTGEVIAATAVIVMGLLVLWRGISLLATPVTGGCCGGGPG